MNIALTYKIPDFVSRVFSEITKDSVDIVNPGDYNEYLELSRERDFDFFVINFDNCREPIERVIKTVKLSTPAAKILVYGAMDTAQTIKLMRFGVDFCFTSNMPADQLRDYLLKATVYDGSRVNQKMHKHRWFVGESKAIRELKLDLDNAINTLKNVVILGPAGTGKSNIARIIHECGIHKDSQFKRIDLSMYDRNYLESQFWINFRSQFEEIDSDVEGLRNTIAGTIYIEHLEEQSPDFIVSLLTMIKDNQDRINTSATPMFAPRVILPWGGQGEVFKNHQALKDDFYLLSLPSLTERKEDIPLLVHTIIDKYAERHNKRVRSISLEAFSVLMNYDWPGNIRELQSIIECAVLTSTSEAIGIKDIGITIDMLYQASKQDTLGIYLPLNQSVQKYQQILINTILETSDNDIDRASALLGLSKNELFNKMKLLNISITSYVV